MCVFFRFPERIFGHGRFSKVFKVFKIFLLDMQHFMQYLYGSLFILPKITLSRVSINKKNVTDLNLVQFGEQGMRLCSFPKKKKKKKRKKV